MGGPGQVGWLVFGICTIGWWFIAAEVRALPTDDSTIEALAWLCLSILPLSGLLILWYFLWRGRRNCQLLRDGLLASATLVSKEERPGGRKTPPYYILTFEFQDAQGTARRTIVNVTNPKSLEDEPQKLVLYDPHHENRAALLDAIPGRPRLAEDGMFHSTSPQWDMLTLLLPLATVIGNGWCLVRYVLT